MFKIPDFILDIARRLREAGFQAYVVGGSVRDLFLGKTPYDWDLTTDATPEEMLAVFPDAKYKNDFGTVMIPRDNNFGLTALELRTERMPDFRSSSAHSRRLSIWLSEYESAMPELNAPLLAWAVFWHDRTDPSFTSHFSPTENKSTAILQAEQEFGTEFAQALNLILSASTESNINHLEEQVLMELELLSFLDIDSLAEYRDFPIEQHFGWLAKHYAYGAFYDRFRTACGRRLLAKSISEFNRNFEDNALPTYKAEKDVVEVTTFRSEGAYSDRRHPDQVSFEKELDKDLERRDFSINAIALDPLDGRVIDLFYGQKALADRIIRTVGEPLDRFKEDALRMVRAARFSAQLGFAVEEKTMRGISKMAGAVKFVANERIRDELEKILASDRPYDGIMILYRSGLLQYIIPELLEGDGVAQNHHHLYSILKHNLLSLKECPSPDWRVRMAALLHDVGKTRTKRMLNGIATFHSHEVLGAKMAEKIMKRLRFSTADTEKVVTLVRSHMFYYNVGEVTESSVRRLIAKVGRSNLRDLIDLRIADRLGSGVPKGEPYKLRHLQYLMKKVQNDPVSAKMLKLNGHDLMESFSLAPSPQIGAILDVLLSEVIDDPSLNDKERLLERARALLDDDLETLRSKAKERIEDQRDADDGHMRRRFRVAK